MIVALIIAVLVLAGYIFMQQPQFGREPTGTRLERIKQSPNYSDGKFQNLSFTPDLKEGVSYFTVIREFFFNKDKRNIPTGAMPSKKIDLFALSPQEDVLVWFGHSSYFIQIDGKKILVDPVLSGSASPIKFTTKSFTGSDVYTVDEIPAIDYLLISHDHYDHLDYETMLKLKPKIKKVITGLGVGEHLEYWGFDKNMIIEKDWNEVVLLDSGFTINTVPARHFSGRKFKRCPSLWTSFVLTTPNMKIFIGGDSGYDTHFAKIGAEYGPFDLAILECGQYNEYWKYIHMMPEEVVQASKDLQANRLMPVHWGKFALSIHAWDEPIIRVVKESKRLDVPLLLPMIGEKVNLSDTVFSDVAWWKDIK